MKKFITVLCSIILISNSIFSQNNYLVITPKYSKGKVKNLTEADFLKIKNIYGEKLKGRIYRFEKNYLVIDATSISTNEIEQINLNRRGLSLIGKLMIGGGLVAGVSSLINSTIGSSEVNSDFLYASLGLISIGTTFNIFSTKKIHKDKYSYRIIYHKPTK